MFEAFMSVLNYTQWLCNSNLVLETLCGNTAVLVLQRGGSALIIHYVTLSFSELPKQFGFFSKTYLAWVKDLMNSDWLLITESQNEWGWKAPLEVS